MAASRTPEPPDTETASYSKMSVGDVEAIGSHCQMPFCHQLDFLPFRCESCKGCVSCPSLPSQQTNPPLTAFSRKYCLDHRTETAHSCPNKGAWARARTQKQLDPNYKPTPRPTVLTHEQQCSDPSCKTLINTPLVTGVHCDKCNREYCLKHRFTYDHNCANLVPLGARPAGASQKERGLAALEKLKAWGVAKRAAVPKVPQSKTKTEAAARVTATANLKKTAKGDEKIPLDKRVYIYVEASSDTVTSKIPKGTFFYSKEFRVGRVLDLAAKSLQVANLNNRSESEEDKLRVFHVEGGRLLEFGEKLGASVQTGNTVVLLRGVGAGMAAAP